MATCPHCGSQLPRPNAHFCAKCGKAINPAPDPTNGVCTNGHPQVRAGARYCYLCRAQVMPPLPIQPAVVPDPAKGVCANGHPQVRSGAHFCYLCRAPVSPAGQPQAVPSGPTFNGRYQVIGELGRGGMGSVVYKVQDLQTPGRVLALKEMDEAQLPAKERQEIVQAFQREADLLQHTDHPNIVKVYDYFQIGDKHYMAMDVVQGKPMDKLLDTYSGGFAVDRVLRWAEQLCDALGYLHSQTPPIIYRDMKPANVMLEDGTDQIKMIDFGIAREFKGGKKKGDTIKFGTDGYAPPEQYGGKGKETAPASDVYALGATLHHLLTGDDPGQSPFKFYNRAKLMRPPVSASQEVADALERAVELNMDKRFQSMSELKAALTGQAVVPVPQKPSSAAPPYSPPIPVPPQSVGSLQLSTTQLDLGRAEKGGVPPAPQPFTVTLSGSSLAQVKSNEGWLVVTPSSASNGQSVEVSIRTEMLTLGSKSWNAPNILTPLFSHVRQLWRQAWWIVLTGLLVGIWWRWLWQGGALILGGAVGLQLVMRSVSWLLPRAVAVRADHTGKVTVNASGIQKTVKVQVTAMPSMWRQVVGWGALVLPVLTELGAATAGLWWLLEWLWRLWR